MRLGTLLVVCGVALSGCDTGPASPTPASCTFTLSTTSITIGAAGGPGSIAVSTSSQCNWTARSEAAWISATGGASATGPGTFSFNVAAASGTAARTGALTVAGQPVSVTQSGVSSCSLSIEPDDGQFPVGGGSGQFAVSAAPACAWLASSRSGWIRVLDPPGGLGTGSRRVSYSLDASGDAGTRTGTITVGAQAFVATQAGTSTCTYGVTPVDLRACETGGWERAVTVDTAAGCGWTASSDASWIGIASGRTGLGPGSIRFTFTSNYDAARQDFIKVRWPAPTEGQNVRVAQEGCTYVLTPAYFSVPACGGDRAFDVFSGSTDVGFCGHVGPMGTGPCVWSALSTASWITVLTPMGHGEEGRHSFRVAPNDNWRERTATITVQYRSLTVWQGPGPCKRP